MKGNEFWLAVVKISKNWKRYYYYTVSFINSTIEPDSQNKGQHSDSHGCDNLQNIIEWGWVRIIHRGWRARYISSSEICIILHIVWQPNPIIVLLFIQNVSKFSTSLPPWDFLQNFGLFLGTVLGYKWMFHRAGIKSIEKYVLHIFAFLPFSLSQKFSYFVFEYPWTPFF